MRLGRACAAVLVAAAFPLLIAGCQRSQAFNGEAVEAVRTPALSGVNWDGRPFHLQDHRGKVAVVFFGYTYCPDVCPFTLAKMKQLYAKLGTRADDVEVIFVSVDPQRDSVEKLARYVPSFDRRFYGLRIEPDALGAATSPFEVKVEYGLPKEGPETASFYFVDHTANFFVVDRQGRLRLKFPPNATVDQMLPDIEKLLAT